MDPEAPGGQQRILRYAIEDQSTLYAAFMPFIRNGGLFVPTHRRYRIGDEVFLLLRLMDESEPMPIAGKVVWATPAGAEGNPLVGVGIQFDGQDQGAIRRKIEGYLADMPARDRPTHTL
ncbi:MAG: PilZ domain-containing protein [Candidatus Thiosymbion ectosymbiont of Robbea hypermnestra]|nr:PilZ domain-containing protein [Candidatus Thiosymbion ectosymbiont of Robbea hypermnestra]